MSWLEEDLQEEKNHLQKLGLKLVRGCQSMYEEMTVVMS